jgi:uncharacterized coiled-coil protein SlyX
MNGTDNRAIFDWLNKFENRVVKEQLKNFNFKDDEIQRIASWRRRYQESISSFVTDSAGSSVPLPWLVGGPKGGYGPLLLNQILKVNPVLIDPNDLRTIGDRVGPLRSRLEAARRKIIETEIDVDTGEKIVTEVAIRKSVNTPMATAEAIGDLIDYMQARVWKVNILMRPKYLIKTLPDEMLRVSATGVYDHGYQYIASLFTKPNAIDLYGNMIKTARQASKIEANANEAGRVVKRLRALQDAGQDTYQGRKIAEVIVEKQAEIAKYQAELDIFDERMAKMLPGMDEALLRSTPQGAQKLMLHPAAIAGMVKRGEIKSVERAVDPGGTCIERLLPHPS